MQVVSINENDNLHIPPEIGSEVIKMLVENPDLPFSYSKGVISFDKYTVGTIQVADLCIEIIPRNPAFKLESMFEMLLYESINNFDESYLSRGFGENQSFGANSVLSQFYYECLNLVKEGLTGGFVTEETCGKEISGPIVLEKFAAKIMPLDGVYYQDDRYTTDVQPNQIIKSALLKVLQMEKRPEARRKYLLLLKEFANVGEYTGSLDSLDNIVEMFSSSNKHYPLTLEFAIKILRDMRTKFNNGSLSWYAFLHNSNDIFEKYVRKVLARGLKSFVTKWDTPREIAVLDDGTRKGNKSFVPDILIDYDPNKNLAKAVLDAKNKTFQPEKGDNLGDVLSPADMYQLTFYCDKLKTKLGGLIYPAEKDYQPINVLIDGNRDLRFVLFGINMNERIGIRHRKLCDNVKKYLLYYME